LIHVPVTYITLTLSSYLNHHWHTGHYYNMFLDTIILCASIIVIRTLLFYVLVSSLHEHYSTLDTSYIEHHYFIYLYHWSIDTLHLYFWHLYHRYTGTLHYYYMYLLYGFTCVHALIVFVFRLHGYSCIPIKWLNPVILIWYSCYWIRELLICDVWN